MSAVIFIIYDVGETILERLKKEEEHGYYPAFGCYKKKLHKT